MECKDKLHTWETLYLDDLCGEPDTVAKKTFSIQDLDEEDSAAEWDSSDLETEPFQKEPFVGFHISHELGRGGVGLVQAATQSSLKRDIALKTALNPKMQRSLAREAMVTGALNHPNIMSIHELIYGTQGTVAIAMPLVQGEPWGERRNKKNLALGEELELLVRVAQAVDYAHECGVLHNDIKLENVMVGEHGNVILMDWG